jgi:hypothetical protein
MRARTGRRDVALMRAFVALTAVICAGLLSAAVLVPAPPGAVAFVALVCIGCPMLAVWGLSSVTAPPERKPDAVLVEELRCELERLPETRHPLDL